MSVMKSLGIPLVFLFLAGSSSRPGESNPQDSWIRQKPVYVSGLDGYDTYRIPAVVVSNQGTLLAFGEGRKAGRGDSGNIDLVLKRSRDQGKTWLPLQILVDDGGNTCGNPAPVVDRESGTIWLPFTKNGGDIEESAIHRGQGSRTAWITFSRDDGATWAEPVEITQYVKKTDWRWYATGPCHGIQTRGGRLVIPGDHSTGPDFFQWYSHIFYSDDRGAGWRIGGTVPGGFTNESTVLERDDGSLYLNMRGYKSTHRRQVSHSRDGGMTWTPAREDPALIEPVCQASVIRYTSSRDFHRSRILFSNPASTEREKLTIRLSYDEGETWPVARMIHPGPAAYSDLVVLPDGTIGCLYERGDESPYETITFARLTLEWLTGGKDRLEPR
ncbi:MAG: exo-alpha-sialidase [bacterium]